ncbi:hypothetical protein OBBRIDRAFT_797172 [Obba rivulosa]|uniref:Uncharacterized protein n=1 Tax=Obba rivulosa TaxID=1052685 RepID=A0A8E2AKV6_9APHY|nr:hypothetical protein OBBRIDRAFT_797172 [Obba rivulosa]
MSKAGTTFGTQSPPLEATGEESPMGVSSINGGHPDAVPDSIQRQQYFEGAGRQNETGKRHKDQVGTAPVSTNTAEKIKNE